MPINLQRLADKFETLLKENRTLQRLLLGEDILGDNRASLETASFPEQVRISNQRGSSTYRSVSHLSISRFLFEDSLKDSRVYRRARVETVDQSIRSSVARTHAWSVFSGLSLGQISNISVIALPLYADDIGNRQHYTFGLETKQPESPLPIAVPATPLTGPVIPNCLELELHLSQLKFYPFDEHISQQRNMSGENADSLSILIAVFRHGAPLRALLEQAVEPGYSQRASCPPDLSPKPSGWGGWKLISGNIVRCAGDMVLPQVDCFTVADLMHDSTEKQIKASLQRTVLYHTTQWCS